ncbi:MAG: M23 family metallopeptidase [Actinomycetia bacterium]|nr:M23 family metallopeptidase [Actinomycetes bacterium]
MFVKKNNNFNKDSYMKSLRKRDNYSIVKGNRRGDRFMFLKPKRRTSDSYGSGYFGASRGSRKHNGVDLCCDPNSTVCSNVSGTVTKLGYPYADDLSFRYVQVQDSSNRNHRFYYVNPSVELNDEIMIGDEIGRSQELGIRYPKNDKRPLGIQEHVHYEVVVYVDGKKNYLDPNNFLEEEDYEI